ncbi:hypothetical protein PHET_06541 [Paragonimus heterotremus]|uniref:Uncharacterized protein n=1 Tax=Paragonimus heterotremus TaxID=100268 RepID=A0A8J4WH48_9TREM|nr:hypothetical protein PHET_06541 [Paragonimus heterotremus]
MRGIGFLLLIFGFICGSVCLDPSLTPSRHKLFVKTVRANSTLTYYQHRLAVNHIAQIPCFVSSSDVDINATDPVAFEWLLNGRQILPHLSFIHGHWDLDGTLTILAAMPRQYTLWCHVRLGDETDDQDFYFAHQIKFFQEPVRLLIIGVLVNMTMDEESWDRKCLHEKFTCDCRRYAGWNATQWFSSGLKNHYVRRVVNDLAMDTCDTFAFCQAVSLDNFECVNVEHDLNASHFLEFSFFINGGKQYLANDSLTYLSGEHIFQMLYQNFTIGTENLRGILHQETGNLYYSTNLQVDVSVFKRYYTFCMGYASTLNRETDECGECIVRLIVSITLYYLMDDH